MEYESDPQDGDDETFSRLGGNPSRDPLEDSVECCIVATFTTDLGIGFQNPDCLQHYLIPQPSSVPVPSGEAGPESGPSPGAGPSGVYSSLDGDSSGPNNDICPPSKEKIRVHRDTPIASGQGEMPARTRATPAEINLLLKKVIEQAVFVKRSTQKQEGQERWRLKFQKVESLQRLDFYDQWCLQIHHCHCRFDGEHLPVLDRTAAETMEIDAASLEKALEEAFLKVAHRES